MKSGERYTDRQFCEAEKRGGIYGLTIGGRVYALTASGVVVLLPDRAAKVWQGLELQENAVSEQWTEEDERAAERAGAAE